jgi:hypothetical protein
MLINLVAEETVMEPQQVESWVLQAHMPHQGQEQLRTQLVSS